MAIDGDLENDRVTMRVSSVVRELPAYTVGHIAAVKRRLIAAGRDVIDLGAGDADFPPPEVAIRALREAAGDARMSRYPFQVGLVTFREAVARYMHRRFDVTVDPMTEILPLIGSKEGLAHLPLAVCERGDVCVVPEPGYPAYAGGAIFAGCERETVPLRPEGDFLVDLEAIPAARLERTRLVFLNYPNNPTAAVAPRAYLDRTVAVCRNHGIVLAYDNPYVEITFDGYRAPSALEIPGAGDVSIEFHSLSKSFAMTGWRIGWAVGHPELIAALAKVKSYVDTGPFLAIQYAAAATLDAADDILPDIRRRFGERRDAAVSAFQAAGFAVQAPRATMYLWIPLPDGVPSTDFAELALEEEALAVLPGATFGPGGRGFFRVALTEDPERLAAAAKRAARALERMAARP